MYIYVVPIDIGSTHLCATYFFVLVSILAFTEKQPQRTHPSL